MLTIEDFLIARQALDRAPVDTQGRSLLLSVAMAQRVGFTQAQIEAAKTVDGCYLQDGARLFVWDGEQ